MDNGVLGALSDCQMEIQVQIDLAMQAGYSTAPEEVRNLGFGAGMGLPNMKKYTDEMRIESELGVGTRVYMSVYAPGNS